MEEIERKDKEESWWREEEEEDRGDIKEKEVTGKGAKKEIDRERDRKKTKRWKEGYREN